MISGTFVRHLEAGSIPQRDSDDYGFYKELARAKGFMANPGRYRTLTSPPTWLKQAEWDLYILSLYKTCKQEDTPESYLENFQRLICTAADHINYGTSDGWTLVQSIHANYHQIIHPKEVQPKTFTPGFDVSRAMVNNEAAPVNPVYSSRVIPKAN